MKNLGMLHVYIYRDKFWNQKNQIS